ncbi:MAG TPA: hypothetical protein VEC18_04530 [Myxococcota bacterium]|nr:hypothetical protein [Myxococcota bacterium]
MADEPLVSERVIDQREWALELAFSLGIADALGEQPRADDVFALLCGGRADLAAEGGQPAPSGAPFRVAFDAPVSRRLGEPVRVVANLPYPALYALSVTGIGAQRWVIDGRTVGHVDPTPLGVAQAKSIVPLQAGPHELTAYLSHGARVDRIELAAYRPFCVAPAAGWEAGRLLTFASSARTLVAALGLERRLPVADVPITIEGEHYETVSAYGGATNRGLGDAASGGAWAVAVDRPAEFSYRARVQQPGVYSLIARVHGDGDELWSIGEDYRVSVRPTPTRDEFAWVHVLTLHLAGGEHSIRALLPSGAGIDTLHLLRRRARDADYIALLEDEGFRSGVPKQPVTQTDAYRSLAQPLFAEIASQFLSRLGDDFQRAPWWVRRDEKRAIRPALRFATK